MVWLFGHHAALCKIMLGIKQHGWIHMMLGIKQHGQIHILMVSGNACSCFAATRSQNMHSGSGGGVIEVGVLTVQAPCCIL
jgi:hypothetical protein